ncbi:hypothetical protein EKO04_004116 [Ascochyta lentis]|uniref:2EXR domain-containing protein n=1 Tax=Ascochyta lentis TaxID=205686 RepID=A0A8H7J600_9PLEO|nr:hypothetical protein EKO04_004116 [Ascochyta lentis]
MLPKHTILNLPGELRNKIYEFCQEEGTVCLRLHAEPVDQDKRHGPAYSQQFSKLLQVCHQLRSEFVAIYREKSVVEIQSVDLPSYLDVFLAPASLNHENAIGNLIIGLHHREQDHGIDILPLLRLIRESKYLQVQIKLYFYENELPDGDIHTWFRKLCHPGSAPLLHAYLDKAVKALEIRWEHDWEVLEICFEVHDEYYESWMETWRERYNGVPSVEEDVRRWSEEYGLKIGDMCWNIGFDVDPKFVTFWKV